MSVLLFIATVAHGAPCEGVVALNAPGGLTPHIVDALDLVDVALHTESSDCTPATLTVTEHPYGFKTTLTLADGRSDTVHLDRVAAIASWTSSRVLTHHLDALLSPILSADHKLVTLYPSLADLRENRRASTTEVVIDEDLKPTDAPIVRPLMSVAESKAHPGTYAFEVAGELYVNHDAPRFNKTNRWGGATRVGDNIVYPYQQCWWVPPTPTTPGTMQCHYTIALLNLTSGSVQMVGKPKLKKWWGDAGLAVTKPLPKKLDLVSRQVHLIELLQHSEGSL